MKGYSTVNRMFCNNYTIFVDGKHQVASVTIEGPNLLRRTYYRIPNQYEIKLSAAIFKEAAYWICKLDHKKFVRLKEAICNDSEYYDMLQEVLKKVYNEYKELIES